MEVAVEMPMTMTTTVATIIAGTRARTAMTSVKPTKPYKNATLALLTNSNCAALIGGPSAAGQAAAIGALAGQLFGNPDSQITFNAGPVASVSEDDAAETYGTTVRL